MKRGPRGPLPALTALALAAAALAACGQAAAHAGRTFAFVLGGGRLQTYAVDLLGGGLRRLASAEAEGCDRLSVAPGGRFVVCSAPSHSVMTFQVGADGTLEPQGRGSQRFADAAQLEARRSGQEALAVAVHPTGRWLLAVTQDGRGRERAVVSYRIDADHGTLEARFSVGVTGVREIEMDPGGRFVWGIDAEADTPTVWAASFDATTGALRVIEREPAGWRPMDLQLAGRFLYVANRDSDDVWGYALDAGSGALQAVGRVAQLDAARGLAADPEGRFVYVAGQSIFAFRREADGRLSPLGSVAPGRAVAVARWSSP